jgi:hypothetical protein
MVRGLGIRQEHQEFRIDCRNIYGQDKLQSTQCTLSTYSTYVAALSMDPSSASTSSFVRYTSTAGLVLLVFRSLP